MVEPISDIQPSLEVAFSNETLLLTSLLGFTLLFAALACLCHLSPSQAKFDENNGGAGNDLGGADDDEYNQLLQGADVSTLNRAQRKARARLIMKKNKRAAATVVDAGAAAGGDNDGDGDNGDDANRNLIAADAAGGNGEDDMNQSEGTRLSRKERQKAAKEEERLYRREYEEIRKLKIKDEIDRREAKDKLLKEKKEAMERERKELQEKELRSWKYMFGEGSSSQSVTVQDFIRELKVTQFLDLQETANRFQVSIEALISRLRHLEVEGRINHGIFDEKTQIYYFVSAEDMTQVAKFIKQRESVTLDEVNAEVSRIILEKKRQLSL
mmetsp:Transcript_77/g.109  ORF Transcript_77/g.109 Transcript_77/m.109 type:complete len:327 (-) Transcript_77:41-1021(-)